MSLAKRAFALILPTNTLNSPPRVRRTVRLEHLPQQNTTMGLTDGLTGTRPCVRSKKCLNLSVPVSLISLCNRLM